MTADDVTDAMAEAAWDAYYPEDYVCDMRKAIAAAINASECVLVPREPTEAMLKAGANALEIMNWHIAVGYACRIYRAILAAATGQGEG